MADRTLAIIRKIMNWHASRSDDFRSPITRGMARTKPQERARSRILTDDELQVGTLRCGQPRVWSTVEVLVADGSKALGGGCFDLGRTQG